MHNHYDKNQSRPRFEPGIPGLQDPVDTNEPSGPAIVIMYQMIIVLTLRVLSMSIVILICFISSLNQLLRMKLVHTLT